MNRIKKQKVNCQNPYSHRYEQLRQGIREAATCIVEELEVAAIELVNRYFVKFDQADSGYPEVCNAYEALRYLHDTGVLDVAAEGVFVPEMHRHDVAMALAFHQNRMANAFYGFDKTISELESAEDLEVALRSANSASECYRWGLALKKEWRASHPGKLVERRCQGEETSLLCKLRSPGMSSTPLWRQPHAVQKVPGLEVVIHPTPTISPELKRLIKQLKVLAAKRKAGLEPDADDIYLMKEARRQLDLANLALEKKGQAIDSVGAAIARFKTGNIACICAAVPISVSD